MGARPEIEVERLAPPVAPADSSPEFGRSRDLISALTEAQIANRARQIGEEEALPDSGGTPQAQLREALTASGQRPNLGLTPYEAQRLRQIGEDTPLPDSGGTPEAQLREALTASGQRPNLGLTPYEAQRLRQSREDTPLPDSGGTPEAQLREALTASGQRPNLGLTPNEAQRLRQSMEDTPLPDFWRNSSSTVTGSSYRIRTASQSRSYS